MGLVHIRLCDNNNHAIIYGMNALEVNSIISLYKDLSLIDKLHIYIRLRRWDFSIFEKYVPKRGKILDFGCGHGFFSLYLENKSKNRKILGLDISNKKIKLASNSRHSKRTSFRCDKSLNYFNKKNNYDCIIALNVLYLLKDKEQKYIISKFYSSLKKGGRFLLFESNANFKLLAYITILREFIMVNILKLTSGSVISLHSKNWWMENLKHNFKDVKSISMGKNHFQELYICEK